MYVCLCVCVFRHVYVCVHVCMYVFVCMCHIRLPDMSALYVLYARALQVRRPPAPPYMSAICVCLICLPDMSALYVGIHRCGACKYSHYCTTAHQRLDWPRCVCVCAIHVLCVCALCVCLICLPDMARLAQVCMCMCHTCVVCICLICLPYMSA